MPERAACRFYVRAADAHELKPLKARVHACFEAGALATGCRAEIRWGITDYLDLKTNWPMAEAYKKNAQALGRDFFPFEHIPAGFAGSTDMGNVSHRVPSIHPMLAVAPPNVIIHNPEFARWAASDQGDAAVIDGAKSLAFTAIDLMCDAQLMKTVKADYEATAEHSRKAVAAIHDHGHGHGGCGLRMNLWLFIAAVNGFLAVAAGAFGAHGLQGRIDAHAITVFETGARYHMYHALAMGIVGIAVRGPAANAAGGFFLAGIVLFSGSLYLLALTGVKALGYNAVWRARLSCRLGGAGLRRVDDGAVDGTEPSRGGRWHCGAGRGTRLRWNGASGHAAGPRSRTAGGLARRCVLFLGTARGDAASPQPCVSRTADDLVARTLSGAAGRIVRLRGRARSISNMDCPFRCAGSYRPQPGDEDLKLLFSRRTTLELVMRRHVRRFGNVRIVPDAGVHGVIARRDASALVAEGLSVEIGGTMAEMRGDIIVDASGAIRPFRTGCAAKAPRCGRNVRLRESFTSRGITNCGRRLRSLHAMQPRWRPIWATSNMRCSLRTTGISRSRWPRPKSRAICGRRSSGPKSSRRFATPLPGTARWVERDRSEAVSPIYAMGNLESVCGIT